MTEGKRIGEFQVIKGLGKGSYGKVYKVQRQSDESFYALKETDLRSLSQMERMDAVNEIRLLVSVNHANVIRYHEAFLHGSKLCVVMEYAPYGDLRYYINKGSKMSAHFPEEAIWRILLQLCRGLAALHANNIIHRDIKPANIFLCHHDLLKIGDLGVAKALTHMHFARTQVGTPCYMAPEVWSGRPYTVSSDLFSMGCVLYEMMMFTVPFIASSLPELKVRISSGQYAPLSSRYSSDLVALCHALLQLDPKRRPSAESILASAAASRWLRVLPNNAPARRWSENGQTSDKFTILDTIVVPRDLRDLNKVLPPPSYGPSDISARKDQNGGAKQGAAAAAAPQSRAAGLPSGIKAGGLLPVVKPPARRTSYS